MKQLGRLAAAACVAIVGLCVPAWGQTPTDLIAVQQSGQVFVTWTEPQAAGIHYRVYRHAAPLVTQADLAAATLLAEVGAHSSVNIRETRLTDVLTHYRVQEVGPPLGPDQGLFVHTIEVAGPGHYAVTTVIDGVEDTTLVAGQNTTTSALAEVPATPRPVLQDLRDGNTWHYVHWVSERDTPFAPAMWHEPGYAFNLRVVYDPQISNEPRPVVLRLHARSGNYQLASTWHSESVLLSPDDWTGETPANTYWYGLNPEFPAPVTETSPPNADYTVRRVMAELDWVLDEFPVDAERVYVRGISMGATGALSFGYRFPDRFAAVHAVVPKFDLGCQSGGCWSEPTTGELLWGSVDLDHPTVEGVRVYDRLDLKYLASAAPDLAGSDPAISRPPIFCLSGRQDLIFGWPDKPATYAAIQDARQPSVFVWDDGTHLDAQIGSWTDVMLERLDELWDYKIHEAIPAFTNASFDDDAGNGDPLDGEPVGGIGVYTSWDRETVVDEPARHELTAFLRSGTGLDASPVAEGTVDWTPRRLQEFGGEPGASAVFQNISVADGALIQEWSATADVHGVWTVDGVIISQAGNRLSLTLCEREVANFCVANPNSTGVPASITAQGSTSVAMNDLLLQATGLPPGTSGLFFFGAGETQTAFGDGFRCVDGRLHRLPAILATGAGTAEYALDQSNLPDSTVLLPGDVRLFQYWYRNDVPGGSGFNLSAGLRVAFCP